MRYTWVDFGNNPNWEAVAKHQINGLYFAINDPRLDAAYLADVRARGLAVGLYVVSNWPGYMGDDGTSGAKMAEQTSWRFNKIMEGGTVLSSFPKVQFDIEQHDPKFVGDCITRWRELHPKQDTSWTMEPMQGGWFNLTLVTTLVAKKVRVVPQYYGGSMQPFAQDVCFKDVLVRGIPHGSISGFYDAAALPLSWDGFAFTQGRLP